MADEIVSNTAQQPFEAEWCHDVDGRATLVGVPMSAQIIPFPSLVAQLRTEPAAHVELTRLAELVAQRVQRSTGRECTNVETLAAIRSAMRAG